MNRKAVLGVFIAILIPLTCYLVMRGLSGTAVSMPRHYLPDSVITRTEGGKSIEDTVWHTLPPFRMVNQLGDTVGWEGLEGKVIVADFFFTRCPSICPRMTLNMKELQDKIKSNEKVGNREATFIHFLSFSIDPERDSVAALKAWADRYQINPQRWWLLTGNKKEIYDLALNDMKLGVIDGEGVDTSFFHTDRFVLIDRNRQVRGYYHGLDSSSIAHLSRDIVLLSLEKDPQKPFFLAGKLELIAIVFMSAIALLTGGYLFLKKEKKNAITAR